LFFVIIDPAIIVDLALMDLYSVTSDRPLFD
jgi:hypothetical protein